MTRQDRLTTAALYVAFVTAALASYAHVRASFCALERPDLAGNVSCTLAAVGLELALLALALVVHARRRSGRDAWRLAAVLGGFVLVSAYANGRHALAVQAELHGRALPAEVADALAWADVVLLAVTLPLVVAVLAWCLHLRAQDAALAAGGQPVAADGSAVALDVDHDRAERLRRVLELLEAGERQADIAAALEVHRNTIAADVRLLRNAGALVKDGGAYRPTGRQVLAGAGG